MRPAQACGKPAEFPLAIKEMGSLKVSVLLKPKKDSEPVLLDLDVSERPNALAVLRALAESGWVVIKESTAVTSESRREDIVSNKVLHTIFNHIRNYGEYQVDEDGYHHVLRGANSSQWVRHPKWEILAQGDIPMLFTNHLGGTKEDKWTTEYDTAGREKDSGVTAPVGAGGTDIICIAGWLYFKSPAPQTQDGKQLDMVITTLVWKRREA